MLVSHHAAHPAKLSPAHSSLLLGYLMQKLILGDLCNIR